MQVLAIWGLFAGLVVGTLMVDILRYMNKPQPLSLRESAAWTGTWVGLAMLFGAAVFAVNGTDSGTQFVTGYITEWFLSVGILFMFLMIFRYFRVPELNRQRVLFWGIVGAIVLRGVFLYGAAGTLSYFPPLAYVFGAFLVYAGIKLLRQGGVHVESQGSRFSRRIVPVEEAYDSKNFLVRRNGEWTATGLVPVVIAVAVTDIVFSAWSVPAILGITQDPFIVYAASLYAILGLRALFYLLEGIMGTVRFLQAGFCVGLMIAGAGMIISRFVHIPVAVSLGVVAAVLGGSIIASLLLPAAKEAVPERADESLGISAGSDEEATREDKEEERRAA